MTERGANNAGSRYLPIIGRRLFALALKWAREGSPRTKSARDAGVSAIGAPKDAVHGSGCVAATREAVDAAVEAIDDARRLRGARRHRQVNRWSAAQPARRPMVVGPSNPVMTYTSLSERLRARIERQLRFINPLRRGAAGGSSFTVALVDDPAEVGYTVRMGENYDTSRRRYGWVAKEDHHTVRVSTRWWRSVHMAGFAVVDGVLTLDAMPIEGAPTGVECYRAIWAVQGRGYQVHTRRGYLALTRSSTDRVTYACHGRSLRGALQRLNHKVNRLECA